jgi:hypothetical protein
MSKSDNKDQHKQIDSDPIVIENKAAASDALIDTPGDLIDAEAPAAIIEANTDAPIDIQDEPVAVTAPAVNSMSFGKQAKATPEPVYVTRVIDGVEKKFRIRGKCFHIKGRDFTATELAECTELIDAFIAKNSGMLEEVFE